jgi:hypothetical protein
LTAIVNEASSWDIYNSDGHAGRGLRRPSQVTFNNGVLTITGTELGTTGGAKLRGKSQKYGTWQFEAYTPAGAGVYHPVGLLWGVDAGSGVDAITGEIDFMEFWNRPYRDVVSATVHRPSDQRMITGSASGGSISGTWNFYKVIWTPDEISFYVNLERYLTVTDKTYFPTSAVDLCLQLDWFPTEQTSKGIASMHVKNIAIYPHVPPPPLPTPNYLVYGNWYLEFPSTITEASVRIAFAGVFGSKWRWRNQKPDYGTKIN